MKVTKSWIAILSLVMKKRKVLYLEAKVAQHFAISFRNIEGSIRQFVGSGSYPIQEWIPDLEDMAKFLG